MISAKVFILSFAYRIYRYIHKYLPDMIVINLDYYHIFRRLPNITNPRRYTEKLQWYKLYGNLEKYGIYADKLRVRTYVEEKIGKEYLVPLLCVWNDIQELDFRTLPKQFVVKLTHGSGYNIICKDKAKLDIRCAKELISKWREEKYHEISREKQYAECVPKIIVEEYISDTNDTLIDYKIFCFNGRPVYIQVDFDRDKNHTRAYYDTEWKRLPFTTLYPLAVKDVVRPDNLEEILAVSSKLSTGFPHVRVDLYNPDGKVYFGELTFTHGSGMEPFSPDEWDVIFGENFITK